MPYHVFGDVRIDEEITKAAHELVQTLRDELRHIERKFPNMKEKDRKALVEAIARAVPVESKKVLNSKYF